MILLLLKKFKSSVKNIEPSSYLRKQSPSITHSFPHEMSQFSYLKETPIFIWGFNEPEGYQGVPDHKGCLEVNLLGRIHKPLMRKQTSALKPEKGIWRLSTSRGSFQLFTTFLSFSEILFFSHSFSQSIPIFGIETLPDLLHALRLLPAVNLSFSETQNQSPSTP